MWDNFLIHELFTLSTLGVYNRYLKEHFIIIFLTDFTLNVQEPCWSSFAHSKLWRMSFAKENVKEAFANTNYSNSE